ncbi:uncharacterized protein G2W53_044270 [Senna tora]|uniref:Uncharacterized protein n=1 Tax=Senna tora TaxID=362788 RepID=A0A834W5Q8_9FABA|nr:uncharacterized protein G2W53_044270 [Senna tora]
MDKTTGKQRTSMKELQQKENNLKNETLK